jgi:hypothetical protein
MKRKKRIALKAELFLAIKHVLLTHAVEMKCGTDRGIRRTARRIVRQSTVRDAEAIRAQLEEANAKSAASPTP